MSSTITNSWFKYIHSHYLIYNICWEDAQVDLELLNLTNQSNVLMITSAGCNALEYLLQQPESIYCVDMNPKQTALLELKLALINQGSYNDFFSFFGRGKSNRYRSIYSRVRSTLSKSSMIIWDKDIEYFNPKGKGLFFQGGSGKFARSLNWFLKRKNLTDLVSELIEEENKDSRVNRYNEIEKKLWSGWAQYLWKTPWLLSLAGVPESQIQAVGDLNGLMNTSLQNIFVAQSAKRNPYWRLYIEGAYREIFTPKYLNSISFETLKSDFKKIRFETTDMLAHLQHTKNSYSHFILLDHMDWLAGKKDDVLERQWEEIINHSEPNAKILFRTAHPNINFISNKIKGKIEFTLISPEWLATRDRVGTYTGTYLGIIK